MDARGLCCQISLISGLRSASKGGASRVFSNTNTGSSDQIDGQYLFRVGRHFFEHVYEHIFVNVCILLTMSGWSTSNISLDLATTSSSIICGLYEFSLLVVSQSEIVHTCERVRMIAAQDHLILGQHFLVHLSGLCEYSLLLVSKPDVKGDQFQLATIRKKLPFK